MLLIQAITGSAAVFFIIITAMQGRGKMLPSKYKLVIIIIINSSGH